MKKKLSLIQLSEKQQAEVKAGLEEECGECAGGEGCPCIRCTSDYCSELKTMAV